jgi:hypothetical protein
MTTKVQSTSAPSGAKSQSKLVRHPQPHPTESLGGFIVRTSEANGYPTPRTLYQLAGMSGDEASLTSLNFSKLAAITGHPLSCLQGLALSDNGEDRRTLRLLGEQVSSQDLSLRASSQNCTSLDTSTADTGP